jgi:hypothetical protein
MNGKTFEEFVFRTRVLIGLAFGLVFGCGGQGAAPLGNTNNERQGADDVLADVEGTGADEVSDGKPAVSVDDLPPQANAKPSVPRLPGEGDVILDEQSSLVRNLRKAHASSASCVDSCTKIMNECPGGVGDCELNCPGRLSESADCKDSGRGGLCLLG